MKSNDFVVSVDDVSFEENFGPKKSSFFLDPYKMNPHDVRIHHFKDARLFDSSIKNNDASWQVQDCYARKKYNQWLKAVRRQQGWEGFRRPLVEIMQEVEDEYGNIVVFRKKVPYKSTQPRTVVARDSSRNKSTYLPQSKEKGVNVDDTNFRPRMFTEKMGREISNLRNKLGLTQADLAKKINIDVNMIRNIEMGGLISFNSQDPMVRLLAKELGVPSIKYQE
ncbi:helix-turn-helix family protein [Moumouvirus maliensis]|nr:helix-turn-helix family protein [Moumouvirus maliensis]